MSVGRVVRHFQGAGKVPVDLEDVLALIREIEPDEHIEVHGVDVDPVKLKGNCYRYKKPPSEGSAMMDTRHALITYSTQMPPFEQRLVCCKELIHILDPDPILTNTIAEVVKLADNMASNQIPNDTSKSSLQALLDSLAIWQAASILFPYSMWEDVMPRLRSGDLDTRIVSGWIELPEHYVATMMQDEWESIRNVILAYA